MSKIIIALCLLAIVFFVAAQEAAAVAPKKDLKSKLVQKIKDKVKEKLQQRGAPFLKRPAVKLPLKERIANLKTKLAKLEAKRTERKAAKSQKPKSRKPKSGKPASRKPKSQKPKSRKPRSLSPKQAKVLSEFLGKFGKRIGNVVRRVAPIVKKGFDIYKKVKSVGILSEHAVAPKSRKPKSGKPASRKPRSRKPKSSQPKKAETKSDAEFLKKLIKKVAPIVKKAVPIVKKGLAIYAKVKSGGILSDAEFLEKVAAIKEKINKYKKFVPKDLKEKIKAKIADKIKANPKFDKIRKIGKLVGDRKELISKIAKQIKKRVAEKKAKKSVNKTEADFKFFNKLKNWWDNKGKNLFEKGKKIYETYKQIKGDN